MKRCLGFTLIEMAIVLVIIGLVAGAAVRIIKPLKDVSRTDVTLQHLALIDKALQLFVVQNGCLPCPADGTIASSSTGGKLGYALDSSSTVVSGCAVRNGTTNQACFSSAGNMVVPWIALGISEDDASDGWGDRIRYIAAGNSCNTVTGPPSYTPTIQQTNGMVRCSASGTSAFPAGTLTVTDNDATTSITNAAYILISSGSDRSMTLLAYKGGSATANTYSQNSGGQYLNATSSSTFYNGMVNDANGASHFDDIVLFKTAPILVMRCGSNACGNPA